MKIWLLVIYYILFNRIRWVKVTHMQWCEVYEKQIKVKNDHRSSSLSSTTAVQKWIISYTSHHFTPHGRYELNKLTSLPMCGFIAQLVEQRTGNAEVTGSNPVEALIFFRLLLSNCLNWKIYCDDHSSLSKRFLFCGNILTSTSEQLLIWPNCL